MAAWLAGTTLVAGMALAGADPAFAVLPAFTVTNTNDSGAGSLRDAITNANTSGGTITFAPGLAGQTISIVGTPLPAINNSITIDGSGAPGLTVSGANTNRVFFVLSGTVAISNIAIANGNATGGAGGSGAAGGGGGMGAGGAIFVNAGTTTISNVSFVSNTAKGGAGGAGNGAFDSQSTGGGGGLGGNGGNAGSGAGGGGGWSGGGGGGGGVNAGRVADAGTGGAGNGGNGGDGGAKPADAGTNGQPGQAASPGGAGGGPGLNTGGGGGGGGVGGGNGGVGNLIVGGGGGGGGNGLGVAAAGTGGGGPSSSGNGGVGGGGGGGSYALIGGGAGGDFGGGGGNAGQGGYGGGAGGIFSGSGGSGAGGFGGGGGGDGGIGGTGGGSGTAGNGGGGGAGFGGAVYVRGDTGAKLVIADGSFSGSGITAGSGNGTGTNGAAAGQDLFLQSGATTTFAPAASKTLSVTGSIADDSAASVATGHSYTAGTGGGAAITIGDGTSTGVTTFSAANGYSGGTTFRSGTLSVSADNNLGAATGGLTFNGGTLQFTNGAPVTLASTRAVTLQSGGGTFDVTTSNLIISQSIGGGGALTKTGSGFLILTGTNNYSGGTTISAGTLVLGTGGTTGSITGNVLDNSLLTFSRSNDVTFDGTISGSGGLTKFGNAKLILTADNTYNNGTVIAAGTLQLGSGGTTGTIGSSTVNDGGTLAFDRSNLLSFGALISGTGGVTQIGTGTTVLTANNTYQGATAVNAGTLDVEGSISLSSLTTVNSNGTLTGTGTVGPTTIAGNGTFMPGNGTPGSSMTVTGSLALQSGAFYMVQLNPTTSSLTNATSAVLSGATVETMFAGGVYVAHQYLILHTTAGVTGAFNPVVANSNLPSGFRTTVSYDANGKDVHLDLALSFTPPPGGLNTNQQNVANAVVGFFNSNGSIPLVFGGLTPAGLTQISGETATGSQQTTFDAMNQFMGVMTDPFIAGRGDGVSAGGSAANGYASTQKSGAARDANALFTKAVPSAPSFEQRWSVWAAGYGGSQTTSGNAILGSNDATSRIYGTAVGVDYRLSPFTIAGFALAGGGTTFNVANAGTGRSDLFQAGAFIRHNVGPAYISAALAYGWQDIITDRTVTVAGVDHLRAEFNANAFSGRAEGGYRFVTPWINGLGITPYAAGQFTTFNLPAYAEAAVSGANTFALAYGAKSVTETRSELGIRTDKSFALSDSILTLRGRFAWAHDFNPDRSIGATFQTLPGASFVVNGAAQAHDSALATASAEVKWLNGFSLAATFEGGFSSVTASYAGKGVARYAW